MKDFGGPHAKYVFRGIYFHGQTICKESSTSMHCVHDMSYSQFIFLYSVIAHLGGLFLLLGWDRGTMCSGYLYRLFHSVRGHHTLGSVDRNMRHIKNASNLLTVR